MEAINLGYCKPSWRSTSKTPTSRGAPPARRTVVGMRFSAYGGDGDYYLGRSVDESMIVLRLRIKEIKMMEHKENDVAPPDWMEWEKQYYYAHYDKDVCEGVGLLQCYLMSLRPIVALGMFAFVALSVMITFGVGLFQAMDIAKSLICITLSRVEP